jgi:hypothetical protein
MCFSTISNARRFASMLRLLGAVVARQGNSYYVVTKDAAARQQLPII